MAQLHLKLDINIEIALGFYYRTTWQVLC